MCHLELVRLKPIHNLITANILAVSFFEYCDKENLSNKAPHLRCLQKRFCSYLVKTTLNVIAVVEVEVEEVQF